MTVTRRLTWEEVRLAVKTDHLDELGRLPEQLTAYRAHSEAVRREFVSVGDYLLHRRFGLPYRLHPEDGRKYVQWPPDGSTVKPEDEQERVVWAPNEFPYALADDVEHLLLWSLRPLAPARVEQLVREHILPPDEEVHFVNPPALQSVRNLFHVHVLVHRKPSPAPEASRVEESPQAPKP